MVATPTRTLVLRPSATASQPTSRAFPRSLSGWIVSRLMNLAAVSPTIAQTALQPSARFVFDSYRVSSSGRDGYMVIEERAPHFLHLTNLLANWPATCAAAGSVIGIVGLLINIPNNSTLVGFSEGDRARNQM